MNICTTVCIYRRQIARRPYTMNFYSRRVYIRKLLYTTDCSCFNLVRMNRITFDNLCLLLDIKGGLRPTRNMLVDEQVALFLHILDHDMKNRVIQFNFGRSGETVSRYFNMVLMAMMRLTEELYEKSEPIPANSTDLRWKWFEVYYSKFD